MSASRLVRREARNITRHVVATWTSVGGTIQYPLKELEDDSDEDIPKQPVNEREFQDLASFRRFLVESRAYQTLHENLATLFTRNRVVKNNSIHMEASKRSYWFTDLRTSLSELVHKTLFTSISSIAAASRAFRTAASRSIVTMGYLEPPLEEDQLRMRWDCVCHNFSSSHDRCVFICQLICYRDAA